MKAVDFVKALKNNNCVDIANIYIKKMLLTIYDMCICIVWRDRDTSFYFSVWKKTNSILDTTVSISNHFFYGISEYYCHWFNTDNETQLDGSLLNL